MGWETKSSKYFFVGIVGVVLFGSVGSAQRAQDGAGCPPASVISVDSADAIPSMGIVFGPPPTSLPPAIGADEAAERACAEEGRVDATSATAKYVLFRSEQFGIPAPGSPVWIVSYQGICVPVYGPAGHPLQGTCAGTVWNVIIHAGTGEFIAAYGVG